MNKINKVKFFLVAATLISGISTATAEEAFDWGGDPNGEIGAPGTSVVDSAVDKPVPVNCHDCEIAARAGIPLNSLFEARGAAAAAGSSGGEDAKQ